MTSGLSFSAALGSRMTDKRLEILRLIGQSGSISQAARDASVSYKAAWQAIDTLTNLAGVPLVARAVGGAGGGGAQVTEAGWQLLEAARQMDQARQQVLQALEQGGAPRLAQWSRLSVRTSLRNQLPCLVQAIEQQGPVVRVRLGLLPAQGAEAQTARAAGDALFARITRESAELLGLVPGQPVLALCKATAVRVVRETAATQAVSDNVLHGHAGRVFKAEGSEGGDEVVVNLGGGQTVVGFALAGSGIRVRGRVLARFDESSVALAA